MYWNGVAETNHIATNEMNYLKALLSDVTLNNHPYWNGVAETNHIATNELELDELLKSSFVRCYIK